ncbi:Homeodomain-like DNA binding domain-containing transcription factor [Mucor lusitanicus]
MNNPIEPTDASSMNRPNGPEYHHSYVRKRTRATAEQLAVLEDTFAVNVSPNSKLRKQLAEQLSMSERSIQIWFQTEELKAQMQMQQAAIRAQLYHYHQQHYGMMSPYGPPGAAPPMIPLPYHHQQPQQPQQPFYYPPPYMQSRVPLPRAQSVDALRYYGNQNDLARSSFPTPGPEPFMPNDCATPPPPGLPQMVPQHHQLPSMSSWSVSPCYPVLESPTRMSRQSMPPSFNPLSHTLVDDMDSATTGTLPSFHSEFGDAGNTSINRLVSFNEKHVLSEDFPDFVHGQMSPSLSPNREHLHPSNSYFDDSKQVSNATAVATPLNESDMWISSSPNIDASEAVNKGVSTQDSDKTVNPSNLTMASASSAVEQDRDDESHYFHATTLTIGTWHRLKLHANDLICLYKAEQQAFVWFITEGGSRFKVETPLTSMLGIDYTPSVDNNGDSTSDIHFYMSQPPLFYMESQDDTEDQWIQCSDFTENKQASRYLRHTLKGTQLKQDLVNLMSKHEETSKLIHFLDAPSDLVNTPFLPSQQHSQLHQSPNSSMVVPSALPYPASSYYCYSDAVSTSMPLTLNNNASLLATSEPPVSIGGF